MKYKLEKPLTDLIAYIRKQDVLRVGEHNGLIHIVYGDKTEGKGYTTEMAYHPAVMKYVNMRLKPVIPSFRQQFDICKKYGKTFHDYPVKHIKYSLICE